MTAELGTMTAELGTMPAEDGLTARATEPGTVAVQGESAVRTNIPVARDRRAAGGRYLGLRTTEKPPARTGWYATYTVRARQAGVHTLISEATAPVETPHTEAASYLHLSVNDDPFTEIARSQPHLYESRAAWGDLPERVRCPYLAARRGPLHRPRAPAAGRRPRAGKKDGDAPPPHGYRLGRRTRMTVDVYNFGGTARRVTVTARPVGGGWTVRAERETRIRVPARGQGRCQLHTPREQFGHPSGRPAAGLPGDARRPLRSTGVRGADLPRVTRPDLRGI